MKNAKFTSGPWFYGVGSITVQSQHGNICDLVTSHNGISMPFEANGELIAIAPEMRDVLQHYLDLLERANQGDEIAECKLFEDMVLIEQVLRKARSKA